MLAVVKGCESLGKNQELKTRRAAWGQLRSELPDNNWVALLIYPLVPSGRRVGNYMASV